MLKILLKISGFLLVLVLTIVLVKKTAPLLTENTQLMVLVSEALFAVSVMAWFIIS